MGFDLELFLIELHKQGFIEKHDIDFMLEHDPIPSWVGLVIKLHEKNQDLRNQVEELKKLEKSFEYLKELYNYDMVVDTLYPEVVKKHLEFIKENK